MIIDEIPKGLIQKKEETKVQSSKPAILVEELKEEVDKIKKREIDLNYTHLNLF